MGIIFLNKDSSEKKLLDRIKLMSINDISNRLTRDAWKSNVQYKLLYKDQKLLTILLMGNTNIYFLKYEKVDKINKNDIKKFEKSVKALNVDRGYYIITGEIEECNVVLTPKVIVEDGTQFTKHHKGYKNINFYRYMPA